MFILLVNFMKKSNFGANFYEIAIFGMKLQNFGRWRLILALDISVFINNDLIFIFFFYKTYKLAPNFGFFLKLTKK